MAVRADFKKGPEVAKLSAIMPRYLSLRKECPDSAWGERFMAPDRFWLSFTVGAFAVLIGLAAFLV